MNLSAATWREVSRLLDEALDLDPAARAGWLAALGQRTPSLAPTVARLLAAHAGAETDDVLQRLPALRELEPEAPRTPDTVRRGHPVRGRLHGARAAPRAPAP